MLPHASSPDDAPDAPPHAAPLAFANLAPSVRQDLMNRYRLHLAECLHTLAGRCQGDWAETGLAQAEAHRLAGAAGLMQDQALSQAARALELRLRGGDLAAATRQWQALASLLALALGTQVEGGPG